MQPGYKQTAIEESDPTARNEHTNRRTIVTTVALGLLPWVAVYFGSYLLHYAVVSFAAYHAVCLLTASVHRNRLPGRRHERLVRSGLIGVMGFALASCAVAYLLLGSIGWLVDPARVRHGLLLQHVGPGVWAYTALFLYFAVVNPFSEELFWRGVIYERFRAASLSVSRSSLASGFLFGAWHWLALRLFFSASNAVVITVAVMFCGWALARVYEKSRSLNAVMLLHALGADVPILIVLWGDVLRHAG